MPQICSHVPGGQVPLVATTMEAKSEPSGAQAGRGPAAGGPGTPPPNPGCTQGLLVSGRVGRDAEHHHHAGAGRASWYGEVHQLQRAGAGLHPGRGRCAQRRALHPDQGGR